MLESKVMQWQHTGGTGDEVMELEAGVVELEAGVVELEAGVGGVAAHWWN